MADAQPPGGGPPPRHGATEPIRPTQGPTEPIPERIRQPIIVPRRESTIAGLPRALVAAAAAALAIAVLIGFLIGRAVGGGDEETAETQGGGGGVACRRALGATLEIRELQTQALANRTQAVQAIAEGDEALAEQLTAQLEPIVAALREAEGRLPSLVERCGPGRGEDGREGGRRKGRRGSGGAG